MPSRCARPSGKARGRRRRRRRPDHTMIIGTQESRVHRACARDHPRPAASCYGPSGPSSSAPTSRAAPSPSPRRRTGSGAMRLQHLAALLLSCSRRGRRTAPTAATTDAHRARAARTTRACRRASPPRCCRRRWPLPRPDCAPRLRVGSLPSLLGLVRAVVAPKRVALPASTPTGCSGCASSSSTPSCVAARRRGRPARRRLRRRQRRRRPHSAAAGQLALVGAPCRLRDCRRRPPRRAARRRCAAPQGAAARRVVRGEPRGRRRPRRRC